MKRVLLQSAYVLHRRPYRESSFLVELLTAEHGRLTVIAKGVRKPRSALQGLLQPFVPLLVSWSGKGELMTLTQVEPHGEAKRLLGECLYAGFYVNELVMGLLQRWDAHPGLYLAYKQVIAALQQFPLREQALRVFEMALLREIGYGLQQSFVPEQHYQFMANQGLMPIASPTPTSFTGKVLQAIAKEQWDEDTLQAAKRLSRLVLAPLLGERQIHSRQLFQLPVEEIQDKKVLTVL